jgi:hypothetical protein
MDSGIDFSDLLAVPTEAPKESFFRLWHEIGRQLLVIGTVSQAIYLV